MSAGEYFKQIASVAKTIEESQLEVIRKAASVVADSIERGRWAYLFGSGHSVIPVLDVFPRYGSYPGFRPLMDPRLMWFNVLGPGGAPELLWLERQEGYIEQFLKEYDFQRGDTLIVYSHGGLNAAPVEAAAYARKQGATVIAVTSMSNYEIALARHSSGLKLADNADITIDNCVPPEDALADIGRPEKVGAGSTVAVILISMALVAEVASQLQKRGSPLDIFVSPNVEGIAPDHNQKVFDRYRERIADSLSK